VRDELVVFDPSPMPQKLLNKRVVIIGGTSGMGLSAAVACKEAGRPRVRRPTLDLLVPEHQEMRGNA
jgi:NAD(P)-dependent dehydrogenase (short-subunit alcohol dehydrogenase family)